ncbi:MAG: RagB/SusD family nutrient uptake outer membrane protein, partial [Clostridia bacterium]|nr:RagB/SusD family nutrient uptake outer membrane protein [Clostridia bacterium]
LIAVYSMFYRQGTWTRNIYSQMQGMADDGVSYAGWTELNEWTKFKYTNYNFDEVNGKMWREHFTTIYRANQVLAHIDKVEFADATHKEDLRAQTLWLRSFYYFYMTALWDNMPLILDVSSAADQPANSSPEAVFAQLETDLRTAIEALPETRDAENTARPTKGAAYALLAKVYINNLMQEGQAPLPVLIHRKAKAAIAAYECAVFIQRAVGLKLRHSGETVVFYYGQIICKQRAEFLI